MLTGPAAGQSRRRGGVRACRSGLDVDALRAAVLPRLRKAVPIDALWWAAADPATLLFTQVLPRGTAGSSGPYFVENEFLHQDVNKWTELARDRRRGHADARRPAVTRQGVTDTGTSSRRWGYRTSCARCCGCGTSAGAMSACTARRPQATFSPDEARFMQRLAPHLAEGLRMGLLRQACALEDAAVGPGLVILGADGAVAGMNDAAGRWLEDLGGRADGSDLPIEISALATRLRHLDARLRRCRACGYAPEAAAGRSCTPPG